MTEEDKVSPDENIADGETPIVERSKTMTTIGKILMFSWGVLVGIVLLNPFGFDLQFIHYMGFALVTFFIIIFYNGMNAKPRPEKVEVTNYVDMK